VVGAVAGVAGVAAADFLVFQAAAEVPAAVEPEEVGDMKPHDFFNQLQHDAIVKAIGQAESKMSGEIRVFVTHKQPDDAVAAAQKQFAHLKMDRTKERNGVLIFVAPAARKFAIIGDREVHAKCGDAFWREVADEMSSHFRKGDFTPGIIHAISRAGQLLAAHFPRHPGDTNQLSDDIAHD
jgi:uncharacterized membrane protein